MSSAIAVQPGPMEPRAVPSPLTVVQLIPALDTGGAARSVLEIARALHAAGHRSLVVSGGGRLVDQLEREGSPHVTLGIGAWPPRSLARIGRLRRLLGEAGADIVHAHAALPGWVGWHAARNLQPRPHFVATIHGLHPPCRWSGSMTRGERLITVSQTVHDFVLSHYPHVDPVTLSVIPRGIDPAAFPYGHGPDDAWCARFFAAMPQLAGAPLLTLPGPGIPRKGHADAIRLIAGLRQRGVAARLLLLGVVEPGREACLRELQALAAASGVADSVAYSPWRADVRDVFAVSALVLQLSGQPESVGRTVIEALALCRPVLGYAHGGVGELLSELYPAGRVPVGNHERLVDRASELLERAPPIAPLRDYRLADMQARVLGVYRELAATPLAQ